MGDFPGDKSLFLPIQVKAAIEKGKKIFVWCLFIEGSLSVITIHTLELLDWKGFAVFSLLMSCNVVSHGPGLTHLLDLEHPLAGR